MLSFAVCLLATALLVGLYRQSALRWHWFDLPNSRSSHAVPTPRGAGVVFVLVSTVFLLVLVARGEASHAFAISWGLGCLIGAAGWWDDLRGLAARSRFAIYACACAGAVALSLPAGAAFADLPVASQLALGALAAFALLWWVNLYNFMDGINGIAACEALFVAAGTLLLSNEGLLSSERLSGNAGGGELSAMTWTIIACVLGFLPWNFPRAKVFMGDAGSAFLGFALGAIALWSVATGALSLAAWLILAGTFIVDTSCTLLVRIATGQRWHEAHRSHAYQRLTDRFENHTAVVLLYSAINVLWVLPWAWTADLSSDQGWTYVLIAYAPLIGGNIYLRAGHRSS